MLYNGSKMVPIVLARDIYIYNTGIAEPVLATNKFLSAVENADFEL